MRRTLYSVFLALALAACQTTPAPLPTSRPAGGSRNRDVRITVRTVAGFEMVNVPAGCFQMGSGDGRRDEQPVHEVCFAHPFWLDRFEITNAQYGSEGPFPGADLPRTNLTWYEARDFCAQRGGRLPTEAEWEYAARGVEGWHYPWGNRLEDSRAVFDKNNQLQPAPVGSKPAGASWVGALDLAGNVWEWTSSLYRPYPYNPADGRESAEAEGERVHRGGWLSYIDYGISGHTRFRRDPNAPDWFIGFRCVVDN
ncbi:MAG TPA: formylglycine-generating enzyme family protein [Aggregatilineales bacterium]|nr:SUMF1/EgtB/PvdO family nonheme iron enzyme [Anaerolineales bacterium]HRE48282.1 formylglycine-generating enzyme family protein [Aggregatilineales bacterium]